MQSDNRSIKYHEKCSLQNEKCYFELFQPLIIQRTTIYLANSCMIVNHDYTALTFWTYCVVLQCLLLSCHSNQKAIFCSCACAKQSLLLKNSHVFSEIQGHYLKSLATVSQVLMVVVTQINEKIEKKPKKLRIYIQNTHDKCILLKY